MRRFEEIFVELEREIRAMELGSQFPTFRALMARYGASQATINRALKRLEAQGWLVRRHGSGLYVGQAGPLAGGGRAGIIRFLVPELSNHAYALMVKGGEESAAKKGFGVEVVNSARFPESAIQDEIEAQPNGEGRTSADGVAHAGGL